MDPIEVGAGVDGVELEGGGTLGAMGGALEGGEDSESGGGETEGGEELDSGGGLAFLAARDEPLKSQLIGDEVESDDDSDISALA